MCRFFRRRLRDDDGFTLVESVAALLVATIIFLALAAAMIGGVRASLTSRQNQQATDFMTRELEQGRLMDFAALGHLGSDLAGDSRIVNCGPSKCFDPGTGTPEKLVVIPVGAGIPDHTTQPTSAQANGTTFDVSRYVTEVPGQDPTLMRRLTVVISWTTYGRSHTRTTSSMVAFSQRGLPLPSFKVTPVGPTTVPVARGADAVFGAKLTNQGATDRWNLTTSPTGWDIFVDDGDSTYDPLTDTTLTADTNGDLIVDTDVVVPAGNRVFWLRRTIGASETLGTSTLTLNAASVGQPTAATATGAVSFTLNVTAGSVTPGPGPTTPPPAATDCVVAPPPNYFVSGYTGIGRTLHNDTATASNTTTLSNLVMNTAAPYLTTLGSYSTERTALPGRLLQPSTSAVMGETDNRQFAQWRTQLSQSKAVSGPGRLRIWVAAPAGETVKLRVVAFAAKSNGQIENQSSQVATVSGFACAGWQELWVDTPSLTTTVPKNGFLGVRVSNVGTGDLRIAYDASGYPAAFTLGQK